jgi:hypothetical protein
MTGNRTDYLQIIAVLLAINMAFYNLKNHINKQVKHPEEGR